MTALNQTAGDSVLCMPGGHRQGSVVIHDGWTDSLGTSVKTTDKNRDREEQQTGRRRGRPAYVPAEDEAGHTLLLVVVVAMPSPILELLSSITPLSDIRLTRLVSFFFKLKSRSAAILFNREKSKRV